MKGKRLLPKENSRASPEKWSTAINKFTNWNSVFYVFTEKQQKNIPKARRKNKVGSGFRFNFVGFCCVWMRSKSVSSKFMARYYSIMHFSNSTDTG